VIDAHVHVWDLADRPQPWTDGLGPLQRSFSLADLAPELAEGDRVVLVQTVADFGESLELLQRAADDPRIAGVVAWMDLTVDVRSQVDALRAAPGGSALVGARHQLQVEPDPNFLSRNDVRAGLRDLGNAGLAFDVVVSPSALPLVIDCVTALPNTRFVLDHAGKPPLVESVGGALDSAALAAWAADIDALARCPNVAVKLSGLVTESDWARWTPAGLAPAMEHVLDAFGTSRVMFGSDWPVCLLAADYAQVRHSLAFTLNRRPFESTEAVWAATAKTWYRLAES
jgi:L-fuconolactonase